MEAIISTILQALATGAQLAASSIASDEIKHIYNRLKSRIEEKWIGKPDAEILLSKYEKYPEYYKDFLAQKLEEAGVHKDKDIYEQAQKIIQIVQNSNFSAKTANSHIETRRDTAIGGGRIDNSTKNIGSQAIYNEGEFNQTTNNYKQTRLAIVLGFLTLVLAGIIVHLVNTGVIKLPDTIKPDPSISPTPKSSASPKEISNQFDKDSFPKSSCGDELPKSDKEHPVSWYPVFVKYSDNNWKTIKLKYCEDASSKIRDNGNKEIQVASFASAEKAHEFKDFLQKKVGSGDVGKPTVISQNPLPVPTKSPSLNPEGFKVVKANCRQSPSAKFMDLEFSSCRFIYTELKLPVKNFSSDWYELLKDDYSIELISPGKEDYISVKHKNSDAEFRCLGFPEDRDCKNRPPFVISMQLRRYSGDPSRTVTVNCNDQSRNVWGLVLKPRCNSNGIYIDIESEVQRSTVVTMSNGSSSVYNPSFGGSTGYITSNNRIVAFSLSLR